MGFYDRISKAKKEYVEGWKNDSKYFYENDYYKWMCRFVSDKEHVLEIGCGSGYSTLALLNEGHKVISIDVNKECLFATKAFVNGKINCTI